MRQSEGRGVSESRTSDGGEHIDFVKIDWFNLREELLERLPADDDRAGKTGDYARYSEPHTTEACPFA
jgi:hypothetical protein